MKFLVDEDLPRSVVPLLRQFGHQAEDVRDVGLRGATDEKVARHAQKHEFCLVTGDLGFANILNYPPEKYPGIVVLLIPPTGTAKSILNLLESFLEQSEIVADLNGKLAVVEFGRVRIRRS
jgi:predicted nuclease of predicted toxin-antitoxin system